MNALILLAAVVSAPPQAPPVEQRLESLERRVADIERRLPQAPPIRTVATQADPTPVRSAVGHTHTCARGHTWDHTMDGGSHNCPVCGLHQTVVDPVIATVQAVQYSLPGTTNSYSSFTQTRSTGCSGPGCAQQAIQSQSSGGWYLGKRLGR